MHPTWGLFGRVKSHSIIAAYILLLEKLVVAGNGRGVIVGCLQQHQNDGVSSGWQLSRAAWPHALHGKQRQQQQREKSRRDQVRVFRQPVIFLVRQHRGAEGTSVVVIGAISVVMDDEFVFTMDTPVDRNYFFDRIIRGLIFAARVEKL